MKHNIERLNHLWFLCFSNREFTFWMYVCQKTLYFKICKKERQKPICKKCFFFLTSYLMLNTTRRIIKNKKIFNWWSYNVYVTLAVGVNSLMSVYKCKGSIFSKSKSSKGIHNKSTKPINDQNLFSRFQLRCWTAIQEMNSKDTAFLEKSTSYLSLSFLKWI